MGRLQLHLFNTIDEVESASNGWNDLWLRSDATLPTARIELVRNWLDCFAQGASFRAIVVEEGDRFVAALPVVNSRWAKVIPVGTLPGNEWGGAGDLLLDPDCDQASVLKHITRCLAQLAWPLFRFCYIRTAAPPWSRFQQAATDSGLGVEQRPSHDVVFIPTPDDWETFRRSWSKDHRSRIARCWRRLSEQRTVQYRRDVPATGEEVQTRLQTSLAIEDSGWKGRLGTSMARAPGIADFVRRLSLRLIPRRELEFAFLEVDGQPIAFEILWNVKGVLHAYKMGYDERFKAFDPGRLLMHEILRETAQTQRCRGYDCLGPISPDLRRWRGREYSVGRLTVAPRRWFSQALFLAYRHSRRPPQRPVEWSHGEDQREETLIGAEGLCS